MIDENNRNAKNPAVVRQEMFSEPWLKWWDLFGGGNGEINLVPQNGTL